MSIQLAGAICECLDKTSGRETTFSAIENGLNITEVLERGIARAGGDRGVADLFRAILAVVVEARVVDVSMHGVEQLPRVEGSMPSYLMSSRTMVKGGLPYLAAAWAATL